MKKPIVISLILFILLVYPVHADPSDVAYQSQTIRGKTVQFVIINANSPDLDFEVIKAHDQRAGSEPFSEMIERTNPIVAINGNYFDAYAETEESKVPWGYIYNKGKKINSGATMDRGSLALMNDGTVIVDNAESGAIDHSNVYTMVEAGPLLVHQGKNVANENALTKFKESKITTQKGQRSAIGITPEKKVIMATCGNVTVEQMGDIMLELGCTDATNLDGGASSALYAKGQIRHRPGRNLNTVLAVYDRPKSSDDEGSTSIQSSPSEEEGLHPLNAYPIQTIHLQTPSQAGSIYYKDANGSVQSIHDQLDFPAKIAKQRTVLSVADIAQLFDLKLDWNEKNQLVTIQKESTTLIFPLNRMVQSVDGQIQTIDTAAVIDPASNKTYLPLTYILEPFGYTITYDQTTGDITVQ